MLLQKQTYIYSSLPRCARLIRGDLLLLEAGHMLLVKKHYSFIRLSLLLLLVK
jgi:hypothetical protein